MSDETTSPHRYTLTIDSQPANLAHIGDWILDAAQACGLTPGDSFKVQLAVDEACSNVIEHAYDSQGGPLELCCCRDGGQVRVTIRDWGRPFDPGAVLAPDLAAPLRDRQIGGLGLHFMHTLMDQVQFTFDDEGNTLVMTKQCPGEEAA